MAPDFIVKGEEEKLPEALTSPSDNPKASYHN